MTKIDRMIDAGEPAGSPARRRRLWQRFVAHPVWLEDGPLYKVSLFLGAVSAAVLLASIVLFYVVAERGQQPRFDYAAFWAAAVMTLEGDPAGAYDWQEHRDVQQRAFEEKFESFLPWHYPPTFQVVVAPLGLLTLMESQWVFTALTFALFMATVWAILPARTALLLALVPATTYFDFVGGQNGFLTGALTGLGLLYWHRRPVLAGIMLGLMNIKPQLAFAAPLAMIVTGRWRMLAAGVATIIACVAVSWALLGGETWTAFFDSMAATSRIFVTRFEINHLYATPYGGLRYVGVSFWPAVVVQAVVSVAFLVAMVVALRRPGIAPDFACALIGYCCVVLSPRVLDYDLPTLYMAALFQVRHARRVGFFAGEKIVFVLALVMNHVDAFTTIELNALLPSLLTIALLAGESRRDPATAALPGAEPLRAAREAGVAAGGGRSALPSGD